MKFADIATDILTNQIDSGLGRGIFLIARSAPAMCIIEDRPAISYFSFLKVSSGGNEKLKYYLREG